MVKIYYLWPVNNRNTCYSGNVIAEGFENKKDSVGRAKGEIM
jgi:hypothetical protein